LDLNSDYEVQCEKYLLGELSEPDSQQFEAAYFADDSRFERFVAVKEDLLDAYARGLLTGEKRQQFEKRFLASAAGRQEIEDARQLIQFTTAASHDPGAQTVGAVLPSERHSLWSWLTGRSVLIPAGALATLFVLAFVSWMLLRNRTNTNQKDNAQANQGVVPSPRKDDLTAPRTVTAQATPEDSPVQRGTVESPSSLASRGQNTKRSPRVNSGDSEKLASRTADEESVALVLYPYTSRSITPLPTPTPSTNQSGLGFSALTSAPRLTLHSRTQSVQLSLIYRYALEGPVEASVSDMNGKEILRRRNLNTGQSSEGKQSVTFAFPTSLLKRNDYIVRLSTRTKDGTPETIAEYSLNVERKPPQRTRSKP